MFRNSVDLIRADVSLIDPHTLSLALSDGSGTLQVTVSFVVIATGTDAAQPRDCTLDDQAIVTSDAILRLDRIPHTLAVVGAGVIGCEYASMFSALGTRVTLIDARPSLLPFVDEEISDALA